MNSNSPAPIRLPIRGKLKSAAVLSGLNHLLSTRRPGECFSSLQIAAACGCSHQAIRFIEQQALKKLRHRLPQELRDHLSFSL